MAPAPPRYFDAAAGLPLHPAAREAWLAGVEDGWADPAKLTGPGRASAVLLDAARQSIAETLDVRADEISFLPSATHALQAGILGVLAARHRAGTRLVHSAVEHSAVFAAADWHVAAGGTVEVVSVDRTGRVDVEQFVATATSPGVAAAVLQSANHEVGTLQPVDEIAEALAARGVPLIVDASQSSLYGPLPPGSVLSVNPQLWGGPAGIGVLIVRRGTRWLPPFPVDETESRHSAGTVSVPDAVAAAVALRAFAADKQATGARLSSYIDTLRRFLPAVVDDMEVVGDPIRRLPHLLTFSCLYADGESLLTELDRRGYAVSSGSSCTSDTLTPSHVLVAMGVLTSGNIRLSLHPDVTDTEIDDFLSTLAEVVPQVRAGLPQLPQDAGHPPQPLTSSSSALTQQPATVVDSRGRRCPLPILDLARAMPAIAVGTELTVLADDPAAASDIAAWARLTGQQLIGSGDIGGGATEYRLRRLH